MTPIAIIDFVPKGQNVKNIIEAFGQNLFVDDNDGDVLDTFHQLDEAVVVAFMHRRKADATIAHHRRGDAVQGRWVKPITPRRLSVIMSMNINKAGRNNLPFGINFIKPDALI